MKLNLVFFALTASSILTSSCSREVASTSCDKPLPHWLKPSDGIGHLRPYIRVGVEPDETIRWQGVAITKATLLDYVDQVGNFEPAPQLILQVSPTAKCEVVNFVRKTMDKAPICQNLKLCGEGRGWVLNGDIGAQSIPADF